jgi:hypothetical protein
MTIPGWCDNCGDCGCEPPKEDKPVESKENVEVTEPLLKNKTKYVAFKMSYKDQDNNEMEIRIYTRRDTGIVFDVFNPNTEETVRLNCTVEQLNDIAHQLLGIADELE